MIAKHYKTLLLSITLLAATGTTGLTAMQETKAARPTRGVTTATYIPLDQMFDEEYQVERNRLGKELVKTIAYAGACISSRESREERLILEKELVIAINKLLAQDANVNAYGKVKLAGMNIEPYNLTCVTTMHLMTPLHVAAMYDLSSCLKILIDADADLNLRTQAIIRADLLSTEGNGKTALHLAAWGGHLTSVKLLVEANANKDALDYYERTPLHDAIEAKKAAIVEYLIEMGAHETLMYANNRRLITIPNDKVAAAIHNGHNKARTRPNWLRIASVVIFCRANKLNPIKNSILDLMQSGAIEEFITGVHKPQTRSHETKLTNKYNVTTASTCASSSSLGAETTSSTSSTTSSNCSTKSVACVIQ